jgi:Na+/H+ antiporter NhaD/arsenite permease-like protein
VEVSPTGIVIFAVTYLLISVSRLRWLGLDRPAAALLGAVLCVVAQALTPAQALAAIDGSTLLLLFGVMGMGAFLAVDGFFAGVEAALVRFARTPARLLGCVVWGSGALSAFITNDAVCVLGAPILVRIIERHRLPPLPYLLALATAANTGSVATLVGNPQNMLCASLGALSYRDHLVLLGPVALLGLALNHGLLRWMFRRELRGAALVVESATPWLRGRALVTLAVIASSALVYTAGADLAWTATAGFVLLMLLHRRDTRALWPRIDWALLLFFSGLFVVVEAFVQSGAPAAMFARFPLADGPMGPAQAARLTGVFLVGSNVVSNVPFILVVREQMATLAEPAFAWELLAMASTFAGNLTLLGSVANIIVAESARDLGGIGFLQYLRVGFPLAVLTTGVGLAWMLLVRAM